MLDIIKGILNGSVANGVGKLASLIGVIAALTPAAIWFAAHKEESFLVVTYGQLVFWGSMMALLVIVAYKARRPGD